jgi:hypothetical protein
VEVDSEWWVVDGGGVDEANRRALGFSCVLSGLAVKRDFFRAGQRSRVIFATGGINGIGGRSRFVIF